MLKNRKGKGRGDADPQAVCLYHAVYAHEDFDASAQILWKLLLGAQKQYPGKPRRLFMDIDGHRDATGRFDHDMRELQIDFIGKHLRHYFTSVSMPLFQWENPKPQIDAPEVDLRITEDHPDMTPGSMRLLKGD